MVHYHDRDALGHPDELTVIEDATQVRRDAGGQAYPSFAYVNAHTIRAHPVLIEALLDNAEPLWTLEYLLAGFDAPEEQGP